MKLLILAIPALLFSLAYANEQSEESFRAEQQLAEQQRYNLILGINDYTSGEEQTALKAFKDQLDWQEFVLPEKAVENADCVEYVEAEEGVDGRGCGIGHPKPCHCSKPCHCPKPPKPPCRYRIKDVCSCPHDSMILGTNKVDSRGKCIQEWACYSFTPSCNVKCRVWDNFLGFCQEEKVFKRPQCQVAQCLFDNLPVPSAGTKQYLTVGPKGWAVVQTQEPSCVSHEPGFCCNLPICLRRGSTNPYCCKVPNMNWY